MDFLHAQPIEKPRGLLNRASLALNRLAVGEVELRRPVLALVGRLLAQLADRAVLLLRIAHAHQLPAPLAGDHHRLAVPAAGEESAAAARIDPALLPMLLGRNVDAQASAGLVAERHPVLPDPAAVHG